MVLLWLLIGIALIAYALWSRRQSKPPKVSAERLANGLEQAEVMMFSGRLEEAAAKLRELEPPLGRVRGRARYPLMTAFQLQLADYATLIGQNDNAMQCLDQAMSWADKIDDPTTQATLRTRAEVLQSLLGMNGEGGERFAALGRKALDGGDATGRPEMAMRFVLLAGRLAYREHARGRWAEARSLFIRSVELSDRMPAPGRTAPDSAWDPAARALFWGLARAYASSSARALGTVLASSGERELGLAWLDRAIELADGVERPQNLAALTEALTSRAQHERNDDVTSGGRRERWLERAASSGLASGGSQGRMLAAQAELALGELFEEAGIRERAIDHYRAAHDHVRGAEEPALRRQAAVSQLALARVCEEAGDLEGSARNLEQVLAGVEDQDPEMRSLAAQAGMNLHRVQLKVGSTQQGLALLAKLQWVIPTLDADARPIYAQHLTRAWAHQHQAQGDLEEARLLFEGVLTSLTGLQGHGAQQLGRWVATDLGHLAMKQSRWSEASGHFAHALSRFSTTDAPPWDRIELARTNLELAHSLIAQGKFEDSLRSLRSAFEAGRDTGTGRGRQIAAQAALALGQVEEDEGDRRKRLETAIQMGRLCGTEEGRRVAESAIERLKNLG